MEIKFSANFSKQYRKANKKIRKAFYQRLQLFKQDSHHPLLRNHSLVGGYRRYRSINITGDWRAIYLEEGKLVIFEMLGKHSQLYR